MVTEEMLIRKMEGPVTRLMGSACEREWMGVRVTALTWSACGCEWIGVHVTERRACGCEWMVVREQTGYCLRE